MEPSIFRYQVWMILCKCFPVFYLIRRTNPSHHVLPRDRPPCPADYCPPYQPYNYHITHCSSDHPHIPHVICCSVYPGVPWMCHRTTSDRALPRHRHDAPLMRTWMKIHHFAIQNRALPLRHLRVPLLRRLHLYNH